MNFYDVLAAEKWGGGIPTINFFDLLFAQSMGGAERWKTYEGTLPATIISTGDDMRQYKIYGNVGGVGDDSGTVYGYKLDMATSDGTSATTTPIYIGDEPLYGDEYVDYGEQKVYRRTENLFNGELTQGVYNTTYGNVISSNRYVKSSKIHLNVVGYITLSFSCPNQGSTSTVTGIDGFVYFWGQRGYIGYYQATAKGTQTAQIPEGATSFAFAVGAGADGVLVPSDISNIMLVEGSTAPSTYIPYLQPTDPPVPLPALPTVEGTTIVDYAGSGTAPEKVYFEYKQKR